MVVFVRHLSVALGLAVLVLFVPAAAAWAQEPAPSPATPTVTILADDQFWVLGFGLTLLIFLLSVHVVGSWRK